MRGSFEICSCTMSFVFILISFVYFLKKWRQFYWWLLAGLVVGIVFVFTPEIFSARLPGADEFLRPTGILLFFAAIYLIPFRRYSRKNGVGNGFLQNVITYCMTSSDSKEVETKSAHEGSPLPVPIDVVTNLNRLVARRTNAPQQDLSGRMSLIDDLRLHRGDIFELVADVEEEFMILIPHKIVENIQTIDDFTNAVQSILAQGVGERMIEEPPPAEADDPVEQLSKLKKMLDGGLIEQFEFDAKKAEILGRM